MCLHPFINYTPAYTSGVKAVFIHGDAGEQRIGEQTVVSTLRGISEMLILGAA